MELLRRLERLVMPSLDDKTSRDTRYRVRFMVISWVASLLEIGGFTALYAYYGLRQATWVMVGFSIAAVVIIAGFRAWPNFRAWAHVSMVVLWFAGIGTMTGEAPMDRVMFGWLMLPSVVATLYLDWRAGLKWAAIGAISIAAALAAEHFGVLPFVQPSPNTLFLTACRLTGLFVTLVSFAVGFDISRAMALEDAEAASHAKSVFLANISHEIRTPMNGVLGMTEAMLHGELTEEQRRDLTVVRRSGEALVSLINDLLDLSKIEAGKLELEPVPFDLRRVVDEVVALHRPNAERKGVVFEVEAGAEIPIGVLGDELRLRQVLNNLVANAVKFTSRGRVKVRARRTEGSRTRVEVVDTGVGIAKDAQARLFFTFEQGDASTTRRFGGTGLGLALCKQLVSMMGGVIDFESQPGRGSTFWFELDLPDAVLPIKATSSPVIRPASAMTVLVVDDMPINLRVAASLLQRAGCSVMLAESGADALARVEKGGVDLVMMDVQMPVMDGYEATRLIRKLPGDQGRVPIVAVTASALPEDTARCRKMGMDLVLIKPLTWKQVVATLDRYGVAAQAEPKPDEVAVAMGK